MKLKYDYKISALILTFFANKERDMKNYYSRCALLRNQFPYLDDFINDFVYNIDTLYEKPLIFKKKNNIEYIYESIENIFKQAKFTEYLNSLICNKVITNYENEYLTNFKKVSNTKEETNSLTFDIIPENEYKIKNLKVNKNIKSIILDEQVELTIDGCLLTYIQDKYKNSNKSQEIVLNKDFLIEFSNCEKY